MSSKYKINKPDLELAHSLSNPSFICPSKTTLLEFENEHDEK